jgi:hypothetical protein
MERLEASVMEETTRRVGPEALEGRGAVALVRRAVGLKIVDSDLLECVRGKSGAPLLRLVSLRVAVRTLSEPRVQTSVSTAKSCI